MTAMEYRYLTRKRGAKYQLIIAYKDNRGKWKQKSATVEKASDTKNGAIRARLLQAVKDELRLNTAYKDITLLAFAEFYASERTDLTYNTRALRVRNIKALPDIAGMPIKEISYMDISAQFAKLKYSANTMKAIYSTVRIMFRAAVKYHIIAKSPAEDFEYTVQAQKTIHRIRTFTAEEMDALMAKIRSPHVLIIVAICRYTGCRVSEAIAVTWKDIDAIRQTIRIEKQYGLVAPHKYGFKPVKNTNGIRTLYMPTELIRHLNGYRAVAPITFDGRLTTIKDGTYINSYIKRHAPGHSPHDFRHTFATTLLTHGADIRTIAALLGDTVTAVERTYLNYTEEMRSTARGLLEKIPL